MNSFLDRFSDYGTNPVKSIIYALRVILIFSIFYFFFHNDWDFLTRDRLRNRLLLLNDYFKTEKGLSSLYEEQERERYATWSEFLSDIEDSKTRIPQYFLNLAKPLYLVSTWSYRNSSRILKRMDILKGRWSDLEPVMRRRSSFIVGVWIFLYILFAIFIRALNALTLSINSFTTLGFGDIPTKGIPRYAAIIQGFIGWFLLTIFSVSLISQLLQ